MRTRIGEDMIGLIEKEDHSRLPEPVFVKGFLRSYANVLGVDGERAVRLYLGDLNILEAATRVEQDMGRSRDLFWPRTLMAMALLLCIVIASVSVDYFLSRSKTDHVTIVPPRTEEIETDPSPEIAPAMAVPAKTETAAPVVGAETTDHSRPEVPETVNNLRNGVLETADPLPAESRGQEEPPKKLLLKIIAVDTTWMRVAVDAQDPKEMTLHPGEQLELEGRSGFSLRIGNATGIRLFLNDQPISVPGKKGQVVKMRIP